MASSMPPLAGFDRHRAVTVEDVYDFDSEPETQGVESPGKLEARPSDVLIALVGATGVGKSTFISHCTDENVLARSGLTSCECFLQPK